MSQTPNFFLSIGKPIKDEYGCVVGKVASFALTPSGKFDAVYIELGDGKFLKHSIEYLKFDGNDVTLTSKIKLRTNVLCDQIPLIWRKDQALKELSEKNKISEELYRELHNNFEGALNQLKSEAQGLIEEINKEIAKCDETTKELNYALVNLEIEHEIGQIDNQSYENAFSLIQENLKRVNAMKSDLEQMRNKLSNILLGDALKIEEPVKPKVTEAPKETSPLETPELPEPPVVVYVKEIGKVGM
ncbi:MAG: CdvA-like protein [Candidatus Bathyarchaeia archaeon]